MTDHSDLIERARAYRPYNHLNDGDLVRQLLEALSSQSLSLSEAREEIERLRGALKPFAKAAEDCGIEDDLRIGVVKPADVIWESAVAVSITYADVECARSVLENGPAGLADAPSNPPLSDLSSLRKGADVAVKPLEWVTHDPDCWYARCPVSSKEYYVIREDGRWWATWDLRIPALETAEEGRAAAQSDFETRIRSALVSGSREDGDG